MFHIPFHYVILLSTHSLGDGTALAALLLSVAQPLGGPVLPASTREPLPVDYSYGLFNVLYRALDCCWLAAAGVVKVLTLPLRAGDTPTMLTVSAADATRPKVAALHSMSLADLKSCQNERSVVIVTLYV
jgi:hypothetical protein